MSLVSLTPEIVHIVLFKLKEQPDAAALQSAKDSIKKLEQVPGAISMFVGEPQIDARTKGFDYGLYSVFASRADLDKYDVSEAHKDTVVNYVRPNVQGEYGVASGESGMGDKLLGWGF